jgi:hypothetical protein
MQLATKTKLFAERYRAARKALSVLDPAGDWLHRLLPLHNEDVRGPGRGEDKESEGRRQLSWIWQTARRTPAGEGDEFEIAEGMFNTFVFTDLCPHLIIRYAG